MRTAAAVKQHGDITATVNDDVATPVCVVHIDACASVDRDVARVGDGHRSRATMIHIDSSVTCATDETTDGAGLTKADVGTVGDGDTSRARRHSRDASQIAAVGALYVATAILCASPP